MVEAMNDDVIKRLKNIEGHIKGIEQMVSNGSYCIDVVRQIHAVQASLEKVSGIVMNDHLHTCLITAIRGDSVEERERVLADIADVIQMKKYS